MADLVGVDDWIVTLSLKIIDIPAIIYLLVLPSQPVKTQARLQLPLWSHG